MPHTSIDRSFLLVTLAFEKELFDTDGLVHVLLELIKTRDLHLALASHAPMTEETRRELDEETDNFIQNFNGSVDQCFDAIDQEKRDQIRSSISPILAGGLARYIELLDAVVAAEQKRQKQQEKRDNPDGSDDDPIKESELAKIKALIEKAELKAGRFYALKEINKDGMGLIYKGLDDRIIRYVAIKTTRKENNTAEQEKNNKCLIREGKIHGRLEHPNILPVFDAGLMESGKPYIVMHLINKTWSTLGEAIARFHAGKPLIKSAESQKGEPVQANATPEQPLAPLNFEKLSDNARSDFRDLLGRFVEVCEAVNHVHSKGFLHRDLKPTNIMVGNHAETFLMDFGLACMLKNAKTQHPELADDPDLIHEGITEDDFYTAGTPEYKAPEQHDNQYGTLDERTDTYALGLILCEIVTGQRPFEDRANTDKKSDSNDLKAILRMEAMRKGLGNLRAGNRTIPRPLQAICQKAVAFEQKDRYQTALELGKDVKNWLDNEAVTSYVSLELRREKIVRWARKRPARAAAIFVMVLMVALGASVFGFYSKHKNTQLAKTNLALDESNSEQKRQNAELDHKNKELQLKEIQTLQESRKLAMTRGAWAEALVSIEKLEQLIDHANTPTRRAELIELGLDKLKALDGGKPGPRAAAELNKMLADYAANPADFSKSQIGRLFVYKGDIGLEALKPGEKSPYAVALQYLEEKDLAYNYARGMTEPNPEKAVAYLDAAAGLDPYSVRPLLVSTFIKLMLGRTTEALSTLKARSVIMPEDNNIFWVEKMIEVYSFQKTLTQDEKSRVQKFLKDQGAEEGYSIMFELFPNIIRNQSDDRIISKLMTSLSSFYLKMLIRRGSSISGLGIALTSNPPAALEFFNKFVPSFIKLNENNPRIGLINSFYLVVKLFIKNFEPIPSRDQAIESMKEISNKYPCQEFALILLNILVLEDRLDESFEILARFPEKSLVLTPRDSFERIMPIIQLYIAKTAEQRKIAKKDGPVDETTRNVLKQLIFRLSKDIPFQEDKNLANILIDNCNLLNDKELAEAIIKTSGFLKPANK